MSDSERSYNLARGPLQDRNRLVELARKHPGLVTKVCDVADERHRLDFFWWLTTNHPEVTVLVNNAGISLLAPSVQG